MNRSTEKITLQSLQLKIGDIEKRVRAASFCIVESATSLNISDREDETYLSYVRMFKTLSKESVVSELLALHTSLLNLQREVSIQLQGQPEHRRQVEAEMRPQGAINVVE
jgi:hypothetical protein